MVPDITNIFTDKYRSLYNSVGYNIHEIKRLRDKINPSIESGCADNLKVKNHSHIINVENVTNAIDALKQGKKGGKWIILQSLQARYKKTFNNSFTIFQ